MKKIAFILNPVSGTGKKKSLSQLINRRMTGSDISFEILFTQYAGHATILARDYAEQGFDTIVAVGGDGSVNEVAAALVHTNVKLGIIPAGSGNGLAHFLKIPFNPSKAIDVICQNKGRTIDTITLNQHRYVNLAGVGFDAMISRKFSLLAQRGFWSYIKLVLSEYNGFAPREYILQYNGKQISRKALLIAFANSNQFGNKAIIAPDAKPDDGLIDVCILKKVPLIKAPLLGDLLLFRFLNYTSCIEHIKVPEITIIQQENENCHLDGDPMECGKTLKIKVDPLSLNIIVP